MAGHWSLVLPTYPAGASQAFEITAGSPAPSWSASPYQSMGAMRAAVFGHSSSLVVTPQAVKSPAPWPSPSTSAKRSARSLQSLESVM